MNCKCLNKKCSSNIDLLSMLIQNLLKKILWYDWNPQNNCKMGFLIRPFPQLSKVKNVFWTSDLYVNYIIFQKIIFYKKLEFNVLPHVRSIHLPLKCKFKGHYIVFINRGYSIAKCTVLPTQYVLKKHFCLKCVVFFLMSNLHIFQFLQFVSIFLLATLGMARFVHWFRTLFQELNISAASMFNRGSQSLWWSPEFLSSAIIRSKIQFIQ